MNDASPLGRWRVIIALLLLAAGYFVFSFLPERKAIAEARAEIQRKQDSIVWAGQQIAAVREAEEELKKTEAYNADWQQATPSVGRLSATFAQIQNLATDAGATITRLDPESAVHYETISRVPVQVGCIGSVDAICEFLRRLEGLDVEIWEEDLVLANSGDSAQHMTCGITLAVFADNSDKSDYAEHSD